jgi:hypothetical protein
MHCSTVQGKIAVEGCSAKQAHSRHYVTAITPVEKGSSYRAATSTHCK